jgi:ubiquinone/menaquinone biosynthesis C-methylase UbiE
MAGRDHERENDAAGISRIHERVSSQFGAAAAAYTTSQVHSDQAALRRVVELAQPRPTDRALDIATGAGHTALALAPQVANIIAYDMTEPMLRETARNAASRGLVNVTTQRGIAEALPFVDATFDIVTVRQAPHHFADVPAALREMARVAKPGARLVIVDSVSAESASLDRQWNYMEALRDPSHVRNYTQREWRAMVTVAGLRITFEETGFATENRHRMEFDGWVRRMNTPPQAVAELTRLFRNASPELIDALSIETAPDGAIFFSVPLITLVAVR